MQHSTIPRRPAACPRDPGLLMFALMVALPEEACLIVPHRMKVGDIYPLSDQAILVVTGMGAAAIPVIQQVINRGMAQTLISLGTAVALSPSLQAGTLCIASEVVFEQQSLLCHAEWSNLFLNLLKNQDPVVQQRLTHTPMILTNREEKRRLHQSSQANLADMESFHIAEAALRHELDFVVIRVIVDGFDLHIPPAILAACIPSLSLVKLVLNLCRRPDFLWPLYRLAKEFHRAQRILRDVAELDILR